jgi:hypothetical protein
MNERGAWTEQTIDGTCYRLFRPSTAHQYGYTIFFLSDEDGSLPLQSTVVERLLEQERLTVVAPVCGPIWSLDVETDQGLPREFLTQRLFPAARQLAIDATSNDTSSVAANNTECAKMALLGHGMGGQALLRVAYDDPDRFPVVAAVEPTIDFHLHVRHGHPQLCQMFADEESARQQTAILHIHPLHWPRHQFFCSDPMNYPWFDGVERLRMKLAASGVPFQCELETTAHTSADPFFLIMAEKAIAHCVDGLERERLRVV